MLLSSLMALSPLVVVLIMLIGLKKSANVAGLIGLVYTILVAFLYFSTSAWIIPNILLSALVGALPVGLVIAFSIVQITVMAESGALARIIAFIKTLSPEDKAVQVLLINVGMGTLLTGLGAVSLALFPPILMGLGYSVSASILLPCLGYLAMCMYALLGIPAVVMATFAGEGLIETGFALAAFMPVVSTVMAFVCLHVAGGFALVTRGFWPALITGLSAGFAAMGLAHMGLLTVTAIIAGMAVVAALLIYVKLRGGIVRDTGMLTEKDKASVASMSLARAASPWIFLLIFSFLMNMPPLFDIVFHDFAMTLPIIPDSPEKLRLFWQAYTWVFVSIFCCLPVLNVPASNAFVMLKKGVLRAYAPFLATALFFGIAYMMNHSGRGADWLMVADNNMILILAHEATAIFGTSYAAATPFLGLIAGFIGGSASSSVAMLTKLQVAAAEAMNASPLILATANGIGGGLAGAISPSKLLSAAATIDRQDAANSVMGYALALTCVVTAVCAGLTQWWAF